MSLIRWIVRKGVLPDNWLGGILRRKPRMVAAVALANKIAHIVWAMMTTEQNYKMASSAAFRERQCGDAWGQKPR
ncbi:hypothetical protein [Agrobacterium sp. El2ro-1b]|uniref:hypothetical protein n=1 Tax=Agrobacterium sp. El2ro-1b TaxID=2969528 RepID=UPI003AAD323B